MEEDERIIIIQTMIDNNGIEEGEFAEYEKEALQSLLDSYKFQRRQLNDAFNRGFIHKDKIKEKYGELCMLLGSYERDKATPEKERIAGGINILNKLLEEE